MTVAVLSLGTELLRGELVNTNASWLAEALSQRGLEVSELACVGDDMGQITATLERLAASNQVIVCTGGLGPTTDDLTTQAVADLLNVPLELDARSLEHIRERFARAGRQMSQSNEKQAWFPRGAEVLDNPEGTAPGFSVTIGSSKAFFLPGVPHEMRVMFQASVEPRLDTGGGGYLHQLRFNTFGLPESAVNDKLAGLEGEFGVQVGYRAHFPEIQVKVLARGKDKSEAEALAERAGAEVRRRLGDVVFSTGTTSLAQAVGELLEQRSLLLGLAESCTGGLVSQLITANPGASKYFSGAVVSYANQVKHEVLGVPLELLESHGAVSQPVAEAMARGACRTLGASVGLAFTGIAGPGGGSETKPVGLVHTALWDGQEMHHMRSVFPGNRVQIQRRAAYAGLMLVYRVLG